MHKISIVSIATSGSRYLSEGGRRREEERETGGREGERGEGEGGRREGDKRREGGRRKEGGGFTVCF